EAVADREAAGRAGLPHGTAAGGPAANRHAERAVRCGDQGRAVRQAGEAAAGQEPERLARLAAEIRGTAPNATGVARLAGRHDPVPAGGRRAPVRVERAVGGAAEGTTREAEGEARGSPEVRALALPAAVPRAAAARPAAASLA